MCETQNRSNDVVQLRRKKWDSLFLKYEQLGEQNPTCCYFSEVNYKLFAKTLPGKKRKKKKAKKNERESNASQADSFKHVNVNDIIDSDNDTFTEKYDENFNNNEVKDPFEVTDSGVDVNSCYNFNEIEISSKVNVSATDTLENNTTEIINNLEKCNSSNQSQEYEIEVNSLTNNLDLVRFIEEDLNSDLKTILSNRSITKLLESKEYIYWHTSTKKEIERLTMYVSKQDLQEYMRYCNIENHLEPIDTNLIHKLAEKMNSNLKELFIKREFSRNEKSRYLKYNKRIHMEWERLAEEIPIEYLFIYGSSVLYSINKIKERAPHLTEE